MNTTSKPLIWIVTGARGVGKSTFCRRIAQLARQAGWNVAGLISLAQIEDGEKTAILVEDVRTGIQQLLAYRVRQNPDDIQYGNWFFSQKTFEWGSQVLHNSLPCDLLIVDELGPLELIYNLGWQTALKTLICLEYRLSLVVIRPELISTAQRLLDISKTISIDQTRPIEHWVCEYWPHMMEINL